MSEPANQVRKAVERVDTLDMNHPVLSTLAYLYDQYENVDTYSNDYKMAIHHVEEHLVIYDPRFSCQCDDGSGTPDKRTDEGWVCGDCNARYGFNMGFPGGDE